uniref:Laminin EGF-like domain-containing protein n=1 Tax=Macrostomum lignano TaxID=282301 RepID=A0A1I8HLF2_9PLAT
ECGRVEGRGLDPKELRICDHNTVGFKCDQCADGYYGNASSGVPDACKPCPCPGNSTCAQDLRDLHPLPGGPVGNSMRHLRVELLRQAAQLPQVCHPDTGVCTKCIHETGGDKCERCKNGYYGNALATSGVKCRSCGCHPAGTNLTATCNPVSGECQCLPNVDGRRCDTCQQGFFNISSGTGCESCACNYTGTGGSATCHADTGACSCLSGVGGLKCDSCLPGFFQLHRARLHTLPVQPAGHPGPRSAGSAAASSTLLAPSAIAALKTGSTSHAAARKCPDCYGVVQQLVNDLRSELAIIETLFDQTPNISAVGDVRGKLERARDRATRLVRYLETLLGPGLSQTNQRLMQNLSRMLDEASNNLAKADTDLNQAQTFLSSRLPAIKRELQQLSQEIDAKLRPINVTLEQAQALLQDYLGLAGDVNKTNTDLLKRLKSVDSASNELERQADELRRLATQRLEESRTLMRELADAPEQVAAAEQRLGQAGREADALLELANRAEAAVEAARERATNFTARYHQLLSQLPQPDSTQLKKLNNSLDDLSKLNEQVKRKHADVSDRIRGAQANLTRVVNGAETDFRTQNDTQARTNQFYRDLLRQKAEVQELLNRSLSYNASAHELLKKLNNYKDSIEASRTDALLKIEELAKVRNVTMSANSTLQEAQRLHDDHFAAATEAAGQANDTKQLASTLYNRSESLLRDSNANLSDAMSAYQQVRSVADSLDNMETRLGQILDRQAETDLKLGQLSKLSSEAKVNASLLQRSAADLAKDIEALVNISKNGDFDAQADALNASIEALLRNATSGGGSGSGGGGVTESEQLRQVSELVSRYQLEQDSVMQEIDWLEKEHERLAKVTQELGAYDGSNCWFHFARNVE